MKFQNSHLNYAHGQHEYDLSAHDEDGKVLGNVSYSVPQGEKEVHINHIEVHPEHRGKGIGKHLIKSLIRHNLGHKIHWGMTTDDGTKLKSSLEKKGYKRFFEWLEAIDSERTDQQIIAEIYKYTPMTKKTEQELLIENIISYVEEAKEKDEHHLLATSPSLEMMKGHLVDFWGGHKDSYSFNEVPESPNVYQVMRHGKEVSPRARVLKKGNRYRFESKK